MRLILERSIRYAETNTESIPTAQGSLHPLFKNQVRHSEEITADERSAWNMSRLEKGVLVRKTDV